MPTRTIEVPPLLRVRSTIAGAKTARATPTGEIWWSTETPAGDGTAHIVPLSDTRVAAEAWGPGADWLLDRTPGLLGCEDDLTGFAPEGIVGRWWLERPFRLTRTDRLWDALVVAILGQKVQVANAYRSRRLIARQHGRPAPGPTEDFILPGPEIVAELGYADFHGLGVERKRTEILRTAAREFRRLDHLHDAEPAAVRARLQRLRGIGPWTAAMTTSMALGDPDAVPVGDFHIPNTIAWHLAGEPRGTDERMLELLEPYVGHRWRVVRLAKSAGSAPKYGPKLSLTDHGLHLGR